MPSFVYKSVDRVDDLDLPMGGTSIYEAMRGNDAIFAKVKQLYTDYKESYDDHVVKEDNVSFFSQLELFNNLLASKDAGLNDDRIAAEIFSSNNAAAREITGCVGAMQFVSKLNEAILATAASFRASLGALQDSFKQTYRHLDIVSLLALTRVVTKPKLVKSRVFETAYILDHILDRQRFLAMSLLLGIMHVQRFAAHKDELSKRPFYNQGSVLFTLLTFSYTPGLAIEDDTRRRTWWAEALQKVIATEVTSEEDLLGELKKLRIEKETAATLSKKGRSGLQKTIAEHEKAVKGNAKSLEAVQDTLVQYGWRILGSCLGIDSAVLPATYAEAEALWKLYTHVSYTRVVDEDSTAQGRDKMLEIFDDALLPKGMTDVTTILDGASFMTTLKTSGLKEYDIGVGRFTLGNLAWVVGWYTSSNHAGLTCSKCGTVHGSRVSLFRVWHRCSGCKKLYCAECATGLPLAVMIGVGATVSALGGWWLSAGALYSAAYGWLAGSGASYVGTSERTSFVVRVCCEGEKTEALS